jgi:hypothetical protein
MVKAWRLNGGVEEFSVKEKKNGRKLDFYPD